MQQHAEELTQHYIAMCNDTSDRECERVAGRSCTAVETYARSWDAAASLDSDGRLRELQGMLDATTQVSSRVL